MHAQSSGMKAFITELTTESMEVCRRSCGACGYLFASGIPEVCLDHLATVTVDGEVTILYLQTARCVSVNAIEKPRIPPCFAL